MWDPIDQAIYGLIHNHPGGAPALAQVANMNAGTLNNKANPAMEGHHLSIKEAVTIQTIRKDYSVLYAEAAALNHSCIPLGHYKGISDTELLESYAAWHAEIGETCGVISKALADRRISRAEFEDIRIEMFEDIQKAFEFLSRLEAVIDE